MVDDIDDVLEVFDDVEDVFDDLGDPEDLVEDFVESPATVVGVLVGGVALVVFLFGLLVTAAALVLAVGILPAILVLTGLALVVAVLALAVVVYAHTSIPEDTQRTIDDALDRADDSGNADDGLTEREAIERLREQYADGDLTHDELEDGIEAVLESDDPERALREYDDRGYDDGGYDDREYDYDR